MSQFANLYTGSIEDEETPVLSDYEIEQEYIEMLNDVYGTVFIAGYEYETARALKETDPIAYAVGLSDYEASRSD